MEVTKTLAKFIVRHRYADIPEKVRHEAARSFLNWVGCAVGAARHETVGNALKALAPFSGPAEATVLGRRERLDIMLAALMNGITSHTFDFDDTHLKTVIHPSGPVASAILALAERKPVKGADFLHAFILGVEAECRIGNAVYPEHYDVGWHITGTTGVFGAAAAAGRLLGLDEKQMTWALGIAATQSSGLREMFGTMCKPFHPGNAARNGLLAALLAKSNFTSSLAGIEASAASPACCPPPSSRARSPTGSARRGRFPSIPTSRLPAASSSTRSSTAVSSFGTRTASRRTMSKA